MATQISAHTLDANALKVCVAAAACNTEVSAQLSDKHAGELTATTAEGRVVRGGHATLRYIASINGSSAVYSGEALEKSQIDAWLDSSTRLDAAAQRWLFAKDGADAPEAQAAKACVEESLAVLEKALLLQTFLGNNHRMTLADLAYAASLHLLARNGILGAAERSAYPCTFRWLDTVVHQSPFLQAVGGASGLGSSKASSTSWTIPKGGCKPAPVVASSGASPSAPSKAGDESKAKKAAPPAAAPPADSALPDDPAAKAAAKKARKEAEKAKKQAEFEARQKAKEAAAKEKAAANAAGGGNSSRAAKKAAMAAEKAAAAGEEAAAEKEELDVLMAVPVGERKDTTRPMLKGYNPNIVEATWYSWWEKKGFFRGDNKTKRKPYVIVIPPPNVTGSLHLGHALTNSIQDTVIRYKRMCGFEALWIPGTDHAGIATQTVVEKKLKKERGQTRHDLGREPFVKEVWKWKEEYGNRITTQLRRLGSSLDWSREAFTMDDKLSEAVKEAFVRMHDEGCIYRDNRLVNWSCTLKSAISDIEVDYEELTGRKMMPVPGYDKPVEFGVLTEFAYPLEGGAGEIVVATTRPETMLGDTAVAVHPEDPRYTHLHGKHAIHPFNGRKIPIITDAELVDMTFGTGAVKITPAHDPNDFQTGKRHNLDFINIYTDDGKLSSHPANAEFKGQRRFEARVSVVKALEEKGLFRGKKDNAMKIPICSRSKDVIEPLLKPQWWVSCKEMADNACKAVRSGELEILPKSFETTWFRWLENIRDWCISRQLWWGHRIPAYYVSIEGDDNSGKPGAPSENLERWVCGRTPEDAERRAQQKFNPRGDKKITLVQDDDVLDTWFSSGLFPFSVFGWPNQTQDLEKFYPTAMLETGHDILFFWVARMVMMGMKLTGKIPFKQIYLHAMVRDAHGRKMSKSLGNVVDPLHVIEGISLEGLHETLVGGNLDPKEVEKAQKGQTQDFPSGIPQCGTDALRFGLANYTAQARDINLDVNRVVSYRHWCNKLWNALKFAIGHVGEKGRSNLTEAQVPSMSFAEYVGGSAPQPHFRLSSYPFYCRWILSRLHAAVAETNKCMENYEFSGSTQVIYNFWQSEICDVFIEACKGPLAGDDDSVKLAYRITLCICLDVGLRLLHPFMPFVTEELWQRLPKAKGNTCESVMLAEYPQASQTNFMHDGKVEEEMDIVMTAVRTIRAQKMSYGMTNKQKPEVYALSDSSMHRDVIMRQATDICALSAAGSIKSLASPAEVPKGCGVSVVNESLSMYMMLAGMVDPKAELAKLEKKEADRKAALEKKMQAVNRAGYDTSVPDSVKEKNAAEIESITKELAQIAANIRDVRGAMI
ncbi:valyl-tRNA synthetase [Pycnococcus provasolii]|mmetsp:Transcript_14013/g.35089  ORF Transcript_14013/g.35089 Transcript_14013/m.35089 type:complete len:1338 (-) Transcript_14013:74-4087(-)